jgi:uncharacterized protein (DUF885 family)
MIQIKQGSYLMKQMILIFSGIILFLSSCSTGDENNRFVSLADNFINKFLALNPEWATSLGDHRYDDRMGDYSLQGVEIQTRLIQTYLDSLKMIDPDKLTRTNQIDYKILQLHLESMAYSNTVLKGYAWNPLAYNMGNAIYALLARDFAPLKERLEKVGKRLSSLPAVLEAAKTNLQNPPRIHTETAIMQNKGNISLLTAELNSFLDKEPEMKASIEPVRDAAVKALEAYGKWLEAKIQRGFPAG